MGSNTVTLRWNSVVDWSEGHFDVISAAELTALGVPASQIKSWVRTGRLHRLHDRVWAVGRATPRPEGRWRAALVGSRPITVLSHHTAGLAHGLALPDDPFVHVTTTTRVRSGGGRVVHRAHALHPDDLTTRFGLLTTALERTLVDLADVLKVPRAAPGLRPAAPLRRRPAAGRALARGAARRQPEARPPPRARRAAHALGARAALPSLRRRTWRPAARPGQRTPPRLRDRLRLRGRADGRRARRPRLPHTWRSGARRPPA